MLRRLLPVLAVPLVFALGCSSSVGDGAADSSGGKGARPGGRTTSSIAIQLGDGSGMLSFDPDRTHSDHAQTVDVTVTPPDTYTVRFALIGDARDAYLDVSEKSTAEDGTTSVVLTAPSARTNFRLRASTEGASTEVVLTPDERPTTTIEVVPAYAGKRIISAWIATVDTDMRCDPLGQVPPPDGSLHGEADFGKNVPVPNVPLGTRLRVTVRAGQFAGGCAEVPALAVDKLPQVSVTVTDKPMVMTNVNLPVSLGIDEAAPWTSAWSSLTDKMLAAVTHGAPNDASALLADMITLTPYLVQDAFEDRRTRYHWDSRVGDVFAKKGSRNAISDNLRTWLTAALDPLSTGAISGTLTSPPIALGTASLTVDDLAGTDPVDSGFPAVIALSWAPAANDQLLFGGTAWWKPSRLAAGLAAGQAKKQVHSADGVPAALSARVSCADVGALIAGDAPPSLFLDCNESCMQARCEQALEAMWDRAQQVAQSPVLVHLSATGAADIDENARPKSFKGTWVGDASLGAATTRVTGPAKGGDTSASPR